MRALMAAALCGCLLGNLSCSVNALTSFADTRSNEALYYSALSQVNGGSYAAALATIGEMESDYASRREVKTLKASAYAGICGLRFLDMVEALGGISATNRIFPALLDKFRHGSGAKIDACRNAELSLESIGAIGTRTADENLFLALVGLAKIGNVLSLYLDDDQDGQVTASTDVCPRARGARPSAPVANDFYEPDLRQLAASLMIALANIQAVSAQVDVGNGALTGINQACTDIAVIDNDVCTKTDPAAFTATELDAVLSLIKEDSATGFGSDCSGDVTSCNCP